MLIQIIKNIRKKIAKIADSGKKNYILPESGLLRNQIQTDQVKKPLSEQKISRPRPPRNRISPPNRHKDSTITNSRTKQVASSTAPVVNKQNRWSISQFQVPPAEGKTRFHDLDIPEKIMHAVFDLGFRYCTPIQAKLMPHALSGDDASGRAQTGTGKTAAFLIAIFTKLLRKRIPEKRKVGTPRVLIVAPTRELVMQIAEEGRTLSKYTPLTIIAVFGGMDYERQKQQLARRPVDIVVATPGRLLDFQRHHDVHLEKVEILVIDEADRMLDMGFIPDMRRIILSMPVKSNRQTLFFSATLTPEVTRICSQWTRNPLIVEIKPEKVEADTVNQLVYITTAKEKYALLYNIINRQKLKRVIVFCNRRDETRKLSDRLQRYSISCALLSGEVPQKKRIKTLDEFKAGKINVLVATDVAGRGIHIDGVSHVINYNLPHDPEDYVHRIGRTGRAGLNGTSVSFACEDDSPYIPDIEKFIGHELCCKQPAKEWLMLPPPTRRLPSKSPLRKSGTPGSQRHRVPRSRPPRQKTEKT